MSYRSKEEYLEICWERYSIRNRAGRTAMINEIRDTFGGIASTPSRPSTVKSRIVAFRQIE